MRISPVLLLCSLLFLSVNANPIPLATLDRVKRAGTVSRSYNYCGNPYYVPCHCRPTLTCYLRSTSAKDVEGNPSSVTGQVTFSPVYKNYLCGMQVTGSISGLGDSTPHGWHIHEFGDVSAADGSAAGGHYNPRNVDHGIPPSAKRHVGDLGNLKPGKEGTASFDFFIDVDTSAILGRGLIVHAKEDDGGQPTGNSGDRLAQCVVGLKGSS